MSIYSNNFWKYAKNYGKEATLDEVFIKWAKIIDLEINLGSEIFREVTAEVNKLFGIKEAFGAGSPAVGPGAGNPSDVSMNGGAIPVSNDNSTMPPSNPGMPNTGVQNNNIPSSDTSKKEEQVKPEETLLGSMLQGEQSNTVPPTNNSGIQ